MPKVTWCTHSETSSPTVGEYDTEPQKLDKLGVLRNWTENTKIRKALTIIIFIGLFINHWTASIAILASSVIIYGAKKADLL